MDSEKDILGQGLRKGVRNEQLFLFLAPVIVYCSGNRAREGGCQGAPGDVNRCAI